MLQANHLKLTTQLVHGGELPDNSTGSIAPILVRTKTYQQKEFDQTYQWQYSRGANPTRTILEDKLAEVEGGGKATVFGSGTAAMAMFFMTLQPDDHVIFCNEIYGGTSRLIQGFFPKWRLQASYSEFDNLSEIKKQIKPNTRYFYIETPTNPSLKVIDLNLMKKLTEQTGIPFVADMTFSPPCTTKAFEYGAETVIHSLSKYYAGHNDTLAGAVITQNLELDERLRLLQRSIGAILSPDECYRVIQGAKTLAMRWQRVSKTAQVIADFLEGHEKIQRVHYPGLLSDPSLTTATAQMNYGCGGVLAFELEAKFVKSLGQFVRGAQSTNTIVYAESLASPETILTYPAHMSHAALTKRQRLSLGISDTFFRLSVGFEDPTDIIEALKNGLSSI